MGGGEVFHSRKRNVKIVPHHIAMISCINILVHDGDVVKVMGPMASARVTTADAHECRMPVRVATARDGDDDDDVCSSVSVRARA